MISYLKGTIIDIDYNQNTLLLVTKQDVGYTLNCSSHLLSNLVLNKNKEFFVKTLLKEPEIVLFWFEQKDELELFKILTNISGIGPKTALNILELGANKIKNAIQNNEINVLSTVKGIGGKSARKILFELNNCNLDLLETTSEIELSSNIQDAIDSLTSLGYDSFEINKKIKNLDPTLTTEEIINLFLRSK